MNKEIKDRYDKIKKGIVPLGYKKTKVGIIPEDWNLKKIELIAPLQRGFDLPQRLIVKGKYPIAYSNGVKGFHNEYKVNGPGVFTGRSGTIGKVFYIEEKFWPHNTTLWVTNFYGNYPKFIYYLYMNLGFGKFNSGTSIPTLNRNDLHMHNLPFPLYAEQTKIAKILTTWDKAIKLKEELIEQKKLQKKGLMQLLLTGIKRVINPESGKEFDGEWKEVKVDSVINFMKKEKVTEPENFNLVSVKLHLKGLEYTNNKPNKTKNARPYYFRENGEILIGRQNYHNGGIAIFESNQENFIASNAISSLKVKVTNNMKFIFFKISFPDYYKRVGYLLGGTGQKEISESMFLKLNMKIPENILEQKIIAQIVSYSNDEINLLAKELDKLKEQKQGLMQLLLTGVVRVNKK
jgi:type I restriction enzyme S subunit